MITLTLPYPPPANKRLAVVEGRIIKTAKAKAYAQEAGYKANLACSEPLCGKVAVHVALYRPRKSGDIDGILKDLLDSMNGIVYKDDSQIVGLYIDRYDDALNPRVELEIYERK